MFNQNSISSALFDLYDVRKALSKRTLNKPKDEDSASTIGDCLDDVISFLESLEEDANHVQ
jgi:hypothetical protein